MEITKDGFVEKLGDDRNRHIKYRNKKFHISYVELNNLCGIMCYSEGVFYICINKNLTLNKRKEILHKMIKNNNKKVIIKIKK